MRIKALYAKDNDDDRTAGYAQGVLFDVHELRMSNPRDASDLSLRSVKGLVTVVEIRCAARARFVWISSLQLWFACSAGQSLPAAPRPNVRFLVAISAESGSGLPGAGASASSAVQQHVDGAGSGSGGGSSSGSGSGSDSHEHKTPFGASKRPRPEELPDDDSGKPSAAKKLRGARTARTAKPARTPAPSSP